MEHDLPDTTSKSPALPDFWRAEPAPGRLTPNALRVLEKRYLARDDEGRLTETPDQMFRRVADDVARGDATLPFEGRKDPGRAAQAFHRMMSNLEFLPNSP